MIKINMAVKASTHAELLEALQAAGPNVTNFYGEVVGGQKTEVALTPAQPTASEPVVVPPELPDEPTPDYDITDVRAALAKVREATDTETMRNIMRKYGAEKLPDLDKAHYAAVMKEATECLQQATPS